MLSPQENLLLSDAAAMLSTLNECNVLLQLQGKANAKRLIHENEIKNLCERLDVPRLVCALICFVYQGINIMIQ